MKPALLVIDVQQHFFDENPKLYETGILERLKKLLKSARKQKLPIIHIITIYKKDKSNWPLAWMETGKIWCVEGTPGATVRNEVKPVTGEETIVKSRFSAFYGTKLAEMLIEKNIDTVLLAGYATDVCLRMTAMDAYNHGFKVIVIKDASESGIDTQEKALEYLQHFINAKVISISDLSQL